MRKKIDIIEFKNYGIAVYHKDGFDQDLVFNYKLLTSMGFWMISSPRDYNSICAFEGKVYVIMKALDLLDMMNTKRKDIMVNEFSDWLYECIITSYEGVTHSSEILFKDMLYALHQWEMSSGLTGGAVTYALV